MAQYGKYDVIRYPKYYTVTDMITHEIVFETRSRDAAHRKAKQLNKQASSAQETVEAAK